MKTFIENNYPGSSQGMVESILREQGFLLTTQHLEHASVLQFVKPKELALQAVAEFEDLDPALDGITTVVYYVVPETKKFTPSIVVFYQKENV